MPLYEYECTNCSERCELLQKVNEPLADTCPHCQAPALKRLISATRFKLKGSGWYVTDFRDQNKTKDNKHDATEKTTTDKATTTEAKSSDVKDKVNTSVNKEK